MKENLCFLNVFVAHLRLWSIRCFPHLEDQQTQMKGRSKTFTYIYLYISVSLWQLCKYIGGSATDSTKLRSYGALQSKHHEDSQGMYVTR
jgi:hypothetical protein